MPLHSIVTSIIKYYFLKHPDSDTVISQVTTYVSNFNGSMYIAASIQMYAIYTPDKQLKQ